MVGVVLPSIAKESLNSWDLFLINFLVHPHGRMVLLFLIEQLTVGKKKCLPHGILYIITTVCLSVRVSVRRDSSAF